ncbi:MAG: hypothetical protein MJZ13_10805 [Bacteroidales bacterium]|nr:hypothetical protein [Bacteroidales bacterium]
MKKFVFLFMFVLMLALGGWLYLRYGFVFGEGIKAGTLNKVERMGYVFKTYEGTVILAGIKSGTTVGSVQSNEFRFSVVDETLADSLMRCSGMQVELRYKEYKHPLLWRGYETAIVTEIVSVR